MLSGHKKVLGMILYMYSSGSKFTEVVIGDSQLFLVIVNALLVSVLKIYCKRIWRYIFFSVKKLLALEMMINIVPQHNELSSPNYV